MKILTFRITAAVVAVMVLTLSANVSTGSQAQTPTVDPAAVQILKNMTDYLASVTISAGRTLKPVLILFKKHPAAKDAFAKAAVCT